ncbi:MAG: NAD(P)-dependent glycerol-3-phosphate dehydrogenase [Holophagaceae bacterium]|nr:NAD(P)-dependent glycerol-3-phosphate dehydrogenase [Holophagaceae bacterium]
MTDIVVFGSGAWGTALASTWARKGLNVTLWAYPVDAGIELGRSRKHPRLPGGDLPESLKVVTSLDEDFTAPLWVSALPTQKSPEVWQNIAKSVSTRPAHFIHVSKGVLNSTCGLLSQALEPILGMSVGVLSGPTFADEVFRECPTAIVLAMPNRVSNADAKQLQNQLATNRIRVYFTRDVSGVELCGALKNILAIASGLMDALDLGKNAKAALLTRGLAEIARLVERLGGQTHTVMGLAGMGDLVLTATGQQSRNRIYGEMLGKGASPDEATAKMGEQVVEGVHTARAAIKLAQEVGVELPITAEVVRLLDGHDPREAVNNLMTRSLKTEY